MTILGTVTLSSSQVSTNTAQGPFGGGIANGDYLSFSGATSFLTLNGSQVDNNTAPNAGGGGIQNLLGTATLNSSAVDGNTSLNGGGRRVPRRPWDSPWRRGRAPEILRRGMQLEMLQPLCRAL